MKRILTLLLTACLLLPMLSGCSSRTAALLPENIPEDNCRNWYEIFVYSFADSDGDRIGDLKGATEKLSYVRDMGFTGVWLMPIMPSPSYHKYDVTDYYGIDPAYGTLDDFKAFLERAHTLGIRVILDLVVNHTSSDHPWFQSAITGPDSPYREYYNFSNTPQSGYNAIRGSYYESRFVSTMPDLNLDNAKVREEIRQIMAYWLDMGDDGFRLDAVTSYYTGQLNKNVEFLSWLNTEAKKIKPDCYIVGEAWEGAALIANYYASGVDSFFWFPGAGGSGSLAKILADDAGPGRGSRFADMVTDLENRFDSDVLMAPFLDNHDMDRIAGSIGVYDLKRLKVAYGMLAMMRGGLYVYYGDEIGMLGSGNDPNKRIGMLWTSDRATVTLNPPGTNKVIYALPSVEEQQADENSLLQYIRHAMNLRNAVPAIARGTTTVLSSADPDLCLLQRTYADETVTLVLNLSNEAKTVSVQASELIGSLDANTEAGDGIAYRDGTLTLDAWGIAVLK